MQSTPAIRAVAHLGAPLPVVMVHEKVVEFTERVDDIVWGVLSSWESG